jgi:hypothetical protein
MLLFPFLDDTFLSVDHCLRSLLEVPVFLLQPQYLCLQLTHLLVCLLRHTAQLVVPLELIHRLLFQNSVVLLLHLAQLFS